MEKDTNFNMLISSQLKKEFKAICAKRDTTASREVRKFMQGVVDEEKKKQQK